MDSTCRTRTIQSLVKAMGKGNILLTHKLQRPEGQWNKRQKTDLIDSLLRKYPINPTYAIKDGNVTSVIDGVQRLSTIRDFINNSFALSKDMEPIIINGVEKNIAGLKFNKLDEDVQNAIQDSELQIYELIDCTEKDIREIFRRQNSGKPLTNKLMRVVHESDQFNDCIYSLTTHPFMSKIMSNAQRKNGTDRDIIIQTLMLVSTNQTDDYTSFRTKDIDNFIINHADECIDKCSILKDALDKFDLAFESKIKIPVTSIPMILYAGYRIVKDKKSFTKLIDIIINFLDNYDANEEYKRFVMSGTGSQENVRGRFDYWRNMIRTA